MSGANRAEHSRHVVPRLVVCTGRVRRVRIRAAGASSHFLDRLHEWPGLARNAVAPHGLQSFHFRLLERDAQAAFRFRRQHRQWRWTMSPGTQQYDVVIVGAGVSGNLIAKQLGLAGKKVLILEAGLPVPDSREEYMENFFLALAKTPEAPYPALAGRQGSKLNPVGELPDPSKLPTPRATVLTIGKSPDVSYLVQQEPFIEVHKNDSPPPPPQNPPTDPETGQVRGLQFSSTFERNGGGTSWHWLGTSLRELENDIRLKTVYGHGYDWPLTYEELQGLWALAEQEIGVAASVAEQKPLEVVGLQYPA